MQRQSLGSPSSKPLLSAAAGGAEREEKRNSISSTAASSAAVADKMLRTSQRAAEHRWIHLIPVLTILCFLVLYLFSHEPPSLQDSQTLGSSALRLRSKVAVSDAEKGSVASAIHKSRRGLQTARRLRHRKLGYP